MDAKTLTAFVPELNRFLGRFADCFCDHRKSVEPIAVASGMAVRTLQEFLSLLSWDQELMRGRLQQIVAAEHAGPGSVGLLDETSFVKKGTKTPGVQRQWCGTLGKVENCVVTVHLGLARGDFQCLLDGDLFLPECWHEDRGRCAAAGIPASIVYRSKWRIALEQLDRATANGVRFDWLTFDEGYGGKPEFLQELTARGQAWVAEIPRSTAGWLVEPRVTERPYRTSPRGRPRSKRRLVSGQPPARRADELLARHPLVKDVPWTTFRLDDRDKGPSVWEVKHVRVWPTAAGGLPGEPCHLLVARHVLQGEDVKYFLSNAPDGTPAAILLRVALTRHRVERCFQDQKSELGLDHYEGRTYTGLIRHLYLTLVSYLLAMRAVESRRGEKPGVDGAAGASRGGGPGAGEVADGSGDARPVAATGGRSGVPPNPQPPRAAVPRQTHASIVERTRHSTHQNATLPTTELAL